MKLGLRVLLFAELCFSLAAGMLGPIYAVFVRDIGGSVLDASAAWAVFMLTMGILTFLFGRWNGRGRNQEKLVIFGYAVRAAGFLGYLFVQNPAGLVMVQIVLGLGGAMGLQSYDSLKVKHLEKPKPSEWTDWESIYYMFGAVAAVFGGLVVTAFGFRSLFVIMFLFSLLGLVSSIKLLYLYRKFLGVFKIEK
jgi:predicted MFS family arabinose efflux permease